MPRFFKFCVVGLAGIGVQLALLALLSKGMGLHYLASTLLAVEGAVVHNFFWHQRWTWNQRPFLQASRRQRLLRFHITSGGASLLGNLMMMRLLVGGLGVALLPASLAAIGCCSLLNFWAADTWVFGRSPKSKVQGPRSVETETRTRRSQGDGKAKSTV